MSFLSDYMFDSIRRLVAERDRARDLAARLEEENAVLSSLLRRMARRAGELREDLQAARLHCDAAWRHVDAVQAAANAERERLTVANGQLSEGIADLEHALAEAEDRIAYLEDALKGSQEVAAWWLKVATNTAAKRMLRPASTADGEGR